MCSTLFWLQIIDGRILARGTFKPSVRTFAYMKRFLGAIEVSSACWMWCHWSLPYFHGWLASIRVNGRLMKIRWGHFVSIHYLLLLKKSLFDTIGAIWSYFVKTIWCSTHESLLDRLIRYTLRQNPQRIFDHRFSNLSLYSLLIRLNCIKNALLFSFISCDGINTGSSGRKHGCWVCISSMLCVWIELRLYHEIMLTSWLKNSLMVPSVLQCIWAVSQSISWAMVGQASMILAKKHRTLVIQHWLLF